MSCSGCHQGCHRCELPGSPPREICACSGSLLVVQTSHICFDKEWLFWWWASSFMLSWNQSCRTWVCFTTDWSDTVTSAKKYIMELVLHNYDSQMRSVLFWPHKWNKNTRHVQWHHLPSTIVTRSLVMSQVTKPGHLWCHKWPGV